MPPDRLDTDRLLDSALVAQVEYYATIGSTNDRAKQCAAAGAEKLPLLVVTEEQTGGRGRGANRWWTAPGSLAFTLLFDSQALGIDRLHSPLIALATGVAIVETIAPQLPGMPVGIRWPNDVYVGSRKLAGILVEVPSNRHFVVGIGLNVNNTLVDAPVELIQRVTSLRDLTQERLDRTAVLLSILDKLSAWLNQLASSPEAVAARADALCLQRGQALSIELGSQLTTGRCLGIAPSGALVLETPSGRQSFVSGVLRSH